jgi:hypothetical protein
MHRGMELSAANVTGRARRVAPEGTPCPSPPVATVLQVDRAGVLWNTSEPGTSSAGSASDSRPDPEPARRRSHSRWPSRTSGTEPPSPGAHRSSRSWAGGRLLLDGAGAPAARSSRCGGRSSSVAVMSEPHDVAERIIDAVNARDLSALGSFTLKKLGPAVRAGQRKRTPGICSRPKSSGAARTPSMSRVARPARVMTTGSARGADRPRVGVTPPAAGGRDAGDASPGGLGRR